MQESLIDLKYLSARQSRIKVTRALTEDTHWYHLANAAIIAGLGCKYATNTALIARVNKCYTGLPSNASMPRRSTAVTILMMIGV
jgi:hypothetical protein